MNKVYKVILSILALIVVVFVLFIMNKKTNTEDNKIKVGVILPLSGQYAAFGDGAKNAMEMSLSDLQDKNIELIFEDDGYDSKKALSAYNKLQTVDNVDVVIGLSSPTLEIIKPAINSSEELLFTIGNETAVQDDNVFEIIPWGAELFKILAKEVSGTHTKIAVVYQSDSQLFKINRDLFVSGLQNQNYVEVPITSNSDTRTEVAKMLSQDIDSYTVFLTTEQASKFINEVLKQKGSKDVQLICDVNVELTIEELFKKISDKNVFEGCVSTMIADTSSTDFAVKYEQLYGVEPNFVSVYGYDSIQIISKYFTNKDKKDWKKILTNKFEYEGVSGRIVFDNTGSRTFKSDIHVFKDGKFVKVEN